MPKLIKLQANKTYATEANAIKAVEKKFGQRTDLNHLTYFIMRTEDGRFFPVFPGERALQAAVYFHFNVVG